MKVQVYSDLHIEYEESDHVDVSNYIEKRDGVDIVILAGDIGNLYRYEQLKNFLVDVSKMYTYTFFVPGNHEFYMRKTLPIKSYKALYNDLHKLEKDIPRLIILNNDSYLVDNKYCLIGSTLWSYINDSQIFPFYRVKIYGFNKYIYNKYNHNNYMYIMNILQLCKQKGWIPIVITHYPPSFKCIQTRRQRDECRYLYANDFDHIITQFQPPVWIAGHTHENFDIKIQNTRIISNQKGKKNECVKEYVKDYTLDI